MSRLVNVGSKALLWIALAFLAVTAVAIVEYRKYSQFRASPDWRVFTVEMTSPGILSPLSRYWLLKPGAQIYHEQLARWLESVEVQPALGDVSNFRGLLSNLEPLHLALLTRSFHRSPEVVLPHIKTKLFPPNQPCYFSTLRHDSEYDDSWGLAYDTIHDNELRNRVRSCLEILDAEASNHFPILLIPQRGDDAENVLRALQQQRNFTLLARITASDSQLSAASAKWLAGNLKLVDERALPEVQYVTAANEVVQRALFIHFRGQDEFSAIESLRNLIVAGHTEAAQEVSRAVIATPDSSFRKDVIVILARNALPLGMRNIDSTFIGAAPRRERFRSHNDYLKSKTASKYSRLARHEYMQTGKSFPTTYCQPPQLDEVAELREFIASYPWFPGTDDAHLRLVSRLLLDGSPDEAARELERLMATDYPDIDAKEYHGEASALIAQAVAGTYIAPSPSQWYEFTTVSRCSGNQAEDT